MIPLTLLAQLQNYQELFLLPFIVGSKLYHAALDRAKVPHEFLNYPTGGHGYGLRGTGAARVWPQATLQWLQKNGTR